MSRRIKMRALVLRTVDYGESDRVVTLLSAERGRMAAFARGARASRRRFGGALEPFTLLTAEARERAGSELLALESVTVERAHGGIRGDLARIACAGYASELARELVRDAEPHPDLFELLLDYLGRLAAAPARPASLRAFELGALRAVGLMPALGACARCGGGLATQGRLAFDPAGGGLLCDACAARAPRPVPRVAAPTAAWMVALQRGGLDAAEREPVPAGAGGEARDVIGSFVEHHLGSRLASRRFLDEIGPVLGG